MICSCTSSTKPPPSPSMKSPFDLGTDAAQRLMEQAQKDVADFAPRAATLHTAGHDPSGNGDFIILGTESQFSITKVAIRLSVVQQLAIAARSASCWRCAWYSRPPMLRGRRARGNPDG